MAAPALAEPRPDLDAHRRATVGAFPDVVRALVSIIGRKQTSYIANVKDSRAIDRWLENVTPQKDVEQRLRLTFHIAGMLAKFDSSAVVQAWFLGLNPEL